MLGLFLLVCIIHLGCCYFQFTKGQRLTKVFLMPLLLSYVLMNESQGSIFIVLALIFGFLGDAFLLFDKNPLYFMCGLGTFLIGHLFYIFELLYRVSIVNHLLLTLGIFVVLLLIGRFMYKPLSKYLGNLKIPVIAYCVTILSMFGVASLFCLTQFSNTSLLALVGAILFVTSDYLLAISLFVKSFKHKDVWIMGTYLGAQLLLVLSLI